MTPDEYCRQKALQKGSSLYYACLFMSQPQRRAIAALQAYCREVAAVVDECADTGVARATLSWWRQEIAQLFAGKPQHPVTQALLPAIEAFGIEQAHLLAIIDGMEMNLDQNRYLDFAALEQYCDRVSGAVGLLSAAIFGHRETRTLEYARTLGITFQLADIVRDAGADSRKGRIYLPLNELQRYNLSAADILDGSETEDVGRLMAFQIERAERYFDDALARLPNADRKAQRPGLIMAAIHRALLTEIKGDGYRVLAQRTSLTPVRKLWIACSTWVSA
jgi:15-cis-phytoene synthase